MSTIVVTGIGTTNPLGGNVADTWRALLAGESGISTIEHEWVAANELPVTFAGQAKVPAADVLERQEVKRLDPSAQFALVSAREAWADAGAPDVDPERILVDYATGIGGLWTLLDGWDTLREKGPRRVLPMTIPMLMPNAAAAAVSMGLGAKGGARTVVSACASGTESIANAYEHLQLGLADIVVAGGTEAVIHPLPIAAFAAMQALSKRNDEPAKASRPYDTNRDGFVLGEGAATLILETKEHALARGAKIYAELAGGGLSADAYHMTAPHPEGLGATKVMENCLKDANVLPTDVDIINMHGTSTPLGDIAESNAIIKVFKEHAYSMNINSTKSMTGHLLGAAGAVEAIASIMAIKHSIVPPTINHKNPDENIDSKINFTFGKAQKRNVDIALSNTFGFGGHNACVLFKKMN